MCKKPKKELTGDELLISKFVKTVTDYRNMVIDNFHSRMGDEDNREPLEKQIVKEFKEAPETLRTVFQLSLLKVVAAPCVFRDDGDSSTRLSAWLQRLAFERLAEIEPLCVSRPT